MNPPWLELNFTPSSIALLSAAEAVDGVVLGLQIVHGQDVEAFTVIVTVAILELREPLLAW